MRVELPHKEAWIKINGTELEDIYGLHDGKCFKLKDVLEKLGEKAGDPEKEFLKFYNKIFVETSEEEALESGAIDYKTIKISELNANLIEQHVEVNGQITGQSEAKAIPEKIKISCDLKINLKDSHRHKIEDFIHLSENMALKQLKKKCPSCQTEHSPKAQNYMDYSTIYIRDLIDKEKKFQNTLYQSKKVYLISQTPPNTRGVRIRGKVIIEPKTKNISILADQIKPLEFGLENFRITDEDKKQWKKYFHQDAELYKQINPDIVGEKRDTAKKSVIFLLHSPSQIWDIEVKHIIRGGLNIVFLGSTKLGKSKIAEDVTNEGKFELGEYTTAETGKRTGLLFTVDTDNKTIVWGSLPLNDLGLVVVDGIQAMYTDEMGEYREALDKQKVIVNMSVKGSALARARNLCCMNVGRKEEKDISEYIYVCKSISDTYVFKKSADITRFDLFVPFGSKDVSGREIAERESYQRPIPKDVFMRHVRWVWSRKPDHIHYTDSAIGEIKETTRNLLKDYSISEIPIVHNGVREVVTRLSVAYACSVHSTDESHEKVIVESEHVRKAVEFYREVLEMLELRKYKEELEGKSDLTDQEIISIVKELNKNHWAVLEAIKHEAKSSTDLAGILGKSADQIKNYYDTLKKFNLIETRTGVGCELTRRGIKLVKWGLKNNSGIEEFNSPNESISVEKLHHYTNDSNTQTRKSQSQLEELFTNYMKLKDKEETDYDNVLKYLVEKSGDVEVKIREILENWKTEGLWFENKPGKVKLL